MTEDDKLIVLPFVSIYNLGLNKQWGIAHINSVAEINYNTDAFDYLVLDDVKKRMIKCLINNKQNKYTDFIDGKGDGLIFLLYGNSGTGKSLTAEATCEHLKKPLYTINVGDLGTDPENMETIMNMVFTHSKRWGAVIVIDEVDVFLEERETNMLVRNAMVGIFLKLLEYYDGIIFLTTNRLNSLDPAVKCRINMMLSYPDLDKSKRKKIWMSLFKKWNLNVESDIVEKLSCQKLNGREIRNYMKMVFAIHNERGGELTGKSIFSVFEECYKLSQEFNDTVNKPNMYI